MVSGLENGFIHLHVHPTFPVAKTEERQRLEENLFFDDILLRQLLRNLYFLTGLENFNFFVFRDGHGGYQLVGNRAERLLLVFF